MVSRDSSRKLSQELRTRGFVVIRGFLPEKNTRLPPVDGGSFMFCADDGICTQACDDEKVTDELRTAAKSMAEVIAHRGNQLFAGPLKQPRKVVARPAETWFRRKVKNAPETPQHCDIYYHARETHPGLFDCAYQDWTQPLIYTLWVMLKRGKSSLVLLPGGHLGAEWDRGGKSVELPAKRHAFGQVVVLNDLAPGDAVVFHCKTPHFSIASEGSGPRMSMDQRFWADPVDPESPKAVRAAQLVERSADIIARLFTGASTDYKGMSAGQQKEEAINLVCLWSVIGCLQPRSVNVKPWLSLLPAPLSADSKSELNFFGFEKGNSEKKREVNPPTMLLDAGTLSNAKWEANCSDIVFAYFATQDPGMMRPFLEFDEANPDRDSYRYFVCHCVLLLTGWGMTPPPDADIMGLAVAALLKCVGGETPPAITAQTREIETEMAICVAIAIQYGFVDPLSPIAHRLAKLMDLPEPSTYAKRKGISAFYIKYHTDYLVALLHATMIRLVSTIYLV